MSLTPTPRPLHPNEAHAALRAGELSVYDVREQRERTGPRVAGADWIPLSRLPFRLDELPRDRPVAFLCPTGRRAATAARLARDAGVDAHTVSGGLRRWRVAGLPLDDDGPEERPVRS